MCHGLDREDVWDQSVVTPVPLLLVPFMGRGVAGLAFLSGCSEDGRRNRLLPEEIPDKMVLADVGAEIVDSRWMLCARYVRQGMEVRAPEHVRFPHYAGRDCDRGDGGVELRMRGREKHLFQQASCVCEPAADLGVFAGDIHY